LSDNYQAMLKEHGDIARARFRHIAYGQNPNSETFKKSYPESYKRYFFKLVKNIITTKNGTLGFPKCPASLVQVVGAREPQIGDAIAPATQNARLKKFKIGGHLEKYKNTNPTAWRSRAFRRKDEKHIAKRLRNVFMLEEEVENCTFEPATGTLNPHW